jgi:hypothetical protein
MTETEVVAAAEPAVAEPAIAAPVAVDESVPAETN